MEKNKVSGRSPRLLILVFLLLTVLLLGARWWVYDFGWSSRIDVILAGNALLFLCTWLSFYFYARALGNRNMHFFLRMMYTSLLVKMILCVGGALLYALLTGKDRSRAVIFSCFGLYILYTVLEVKILMRMSKLQKNA